MVGTFQLLWVDTVVSTTGAYERQCEVLDGTQLSLKERYFL
ncbi:MAG TPA: hypothetical protein VHZ30_02880 [Verrucomicrobiae bacterium]|nr:hypothetical protein [Verrucomicrobiae bacterium]